MQSDTSCGVCTINGYKQLMIFDSYVTCLQRNGLTALEPWTKKASREKAVSQAQSVNATWRRAKLQD